MAVVNFLFPSYYFGVSFFSSRYHEKSLFFCPCFCTSVCVQARIKAIASAQAISKRTGTIYRRRWRRKIVRPCGHTSPKRLCLMEKRLKSAFFMCPRTYRCKYCSSNELFLPISDGWVLMTRRSIKNISFCRFQIPKECNSKVVHKVVFNGCNSNSVAIHRKLFVKLLSR